MSPVPPSADGAPALAKAMHAHWRAFLAEGIILVVLGLAAIVVPAVAGLAATVVLGWLFAAAGIAGLIATLRARGAPGYPWALLSAILALVAGGVLLWSPLQGLVTLTLVLIAFFVVDGAFMIFLAIAHRRQQSGRWEWLLINGLVDLVLAGLILSGLPGTLTWALGLLLGIDLAFGGAILIGMAMHARKSASLS